MFYAILQNIPKTLINFVLFYVTEYPSNYSKNYIYSACFMLIILQIIPTTLICSVKFYAKALYLQIISSILIILW